MDHQQDYVLRTVEERRARLVRLWFTDVLGQLKSVAISPVELEAAFEEGVQFDGSAIDGFSRVQESDVLAFPDPNSFQLMPARDGEEVTARIFCDITRLDGAPFEGDPRQVLKRNLAAASEAGFQFMCAPEVEFFYLASDDPRDPQPLDSASYFDLTTYDETSDIRRRTIQRLEGSGIPVEYSFHEDAPSQHEIDLRYADALTMADNHAVYKNGAREIAWLEDRCLTFMAKPAFDDAGSSCHIHSSLWDTANGRSVMASQDDGNAPSEVFRWFLGGLLATAAELSLCFAPFVNSYKRYQPGSWAPTAIGWDTDNRTLGFRVVGHGQAMRVESRVPGSDCNPYVAEAAMLAGGLHGIQNRIEPPEPTKGNGYESDLPRIPSTLVEAIELFDGSEVARSAFGEEAHFHLLHMAREEWAAFNRTVTDWELRRNFEQL